MLLNHTLKKWVKTVSFMCIYHNLKMEDFNMSFIIRKLLWAMFNILYHENTEYTHFFLQIKPEEYQKSNILIAKRIYYGNARVVQYLEMN